MTAIKDTEFEGGMGVATGELAADLQGVARDLAKLKPGGVAASAISATAASDAVASSVAAAVASAVLDADVTAAGDSAVTAVSDAQVETGIVDGLITTNPTTPSSQITGAGNTTWNENIALGYAKVNSVGKYEAAQNDFSLHAGSKLLDEGQAVYCWIVEKNVGGTVSTDKVMGTPALLGAETIPNDADITAACGAYWAKLALCHLSRTGDLVVAQTRDLNYRQYYGSVGAVALANDLKLKYNAAVTLINDLKTKYNLAVSLINDLKSKYNANVTLVNDLETKYNAAVTLINELKNDLGEARTLSNEIRSDLNAVTAQTIETTDGG